MSVFPQHSGVLSPAGHITITLPTEAAGTHTSSPTAVRPDLLVTTKLALPPSRPGLVLRARLTDRLEAGLQGKLTLISAPAGYGKTTLVSAWHATESGQAWPLAWVSLDPGDNDPVRFWTYVISALQTVHAGLGVDTLALLQSPHPPSLTAVLTRLINTLTAMAAPLVLVLDDYHMITAPQVHQSLTFLLDHQPPQLRLVITSRVDPSLPLMRLRARGELTDLRAADLSFTTSEVEIFCNQLLNLGLDADAVAALAARTEGWIAGLVLAAHALHGHADAGAFIRVLSGSQRFILDYLVEDVLQQQPSHIQRFLLDTAILDRLSAALCDAVTEQHESQRVLEVLEQANVFLVPLDQERRWYRYHQLFGEMLRSRAQQLQPDRLPALHCRATAWCVQQGLIAEAVNHALAAGHMEQAASLIEQVAEATFLRGEVRMLLAWLNALPHTLVQARPQLSLVHSWALVFTGQVDAAQAQLEDGGQRMQQQARAGEGQFRSGAAALQALVAGQRGDISGLIAHSQEAVAHDGADSGEPHSLSLLALGNAHFFNGDLAAADQALTAVIDAYRGHGGLLPTMLAIYILADAKLHQGQLHQATELLQRGVQLGTGPDGHSLPISGLAYMGLGDVLRERNELNAALHHLHSGIQLATRWGIHVMRVDGMIALARLHQARGDQQGGLQVLRDCEEYMRYAWATPWHRTQLAACRARLWLAGGQRALASQWARHYAQQLQAARPNLGPMIKYGFAHTTLARVRLAEGRPEETMQVLGYLLSLAEAGDWTGDVIEILALQALALQMQGATAQALTILDRALALAEPEGYIRIFMDEGAPMVALLGELLEGQRTGLPASRKHVSTAYLQRLLAAAGVSLRSRDASPQPLVEILSERELEVLRLLATGLESPEIASKLIIGVSTVRTHIKNIYGKLGVHSRILAIEQARALGILH